VIRTGRGGIGERREGSRVGGRGRMAGGAEDKEDYRL
jgi:hypothetical protein